ncbi:hypothetical protein ACRALDRAFT_2043469 [Sodiomyces alcalophilus JCM 7366]|uniref:uncharacterized protein n=1 Tax=Sodiomyces alcalophilus JCM 7366 TaxID=591952 RepID=UPI0039B3C8E5
MAVKDGISYYPTEGLISKKGRKHYRIPVRSQHWQLRSLTSADKSDTVYFPGGHSSNHIQRLNTTTNECETLKLLSFSPRCLVAGKGWVCCGGETGEFSAIHLDERGDPIESDRHLDLDPDMRLPLDLDSLRNDAAPSALFHSQLRRLNSRLSKGLVAKSVKMARDRVNCITLWFPPAGAPRQEAGTYKDPVAVLANNDKSVVTLSLRDFETKTKPDPLDVITYPDYVNRAVLSPGGRILVAVLDDPYLYVHVRAEKKADDQNSARRRPVSRDTPEYEWVLCRRILLKSQRRDDRSDSRGSFAACFSNTGTHLAVGTQYGTISIFDTQSLINPDGPDPLLATFTTSRPLTSAGAVRDMEFCPGPFDILAWTEHQGRVGLADVRTGFVHRQTLDISADDGDVERLSLADRNSTPDARDSDHTSRILASVLPSNISASDWRRFREEMQAFYGDDRSDGLSHEEMAVLEAIQTERRRRELAERIESRLAGQLGSGSGSSRWHVTPVPPPPNRLLSRLGAGAEDDHGRASRDRAGGISRALREFDRETADGDSSSASNNTNIHTLAGWLRETRDRGQGHERPRATHRLGEDGGDRRVRVRPVPRRTTTLRPGEASPPPSSSPGGLQSTATRSAGLTGGWDDISALHNRSSLESNLAGARSGDDDDDDDDGDGANTTQRERDADLDRERERDFLSILPFINSVSVREMDDRLARRRMVVDPGTHERTRERTRESDNIAGLSWGENGRVLYIGAENGIYEYHVDVQGRKFYPDVTMR